MASSDDEGSDWVVRPMAVLRRLDPAESYALCVHYEPGARKPKWVADAADTYLAELKRDQRLPENLDDMALLLLRRHLPGATWQGQPSSSSNERHISGYPHYRALTVGSVRVSATELSVWLEERNSRRPNWRKLI